MNTTIERNKRKIQKNLKLFHTSLEVLTERKYFATKSIFYTACIQRHGQFNIPVDTICKRRLRAKKLRAFFLKMRRR